MSHCKEKQKYWRHLHHHSHQWMYLNTKFNHSFVNNLFGVACMGTSLIKNTHPPRISIDP